MRALLHKDSTSGAYLLASNWRIPHLVMRDVVQGESSTALITVGDYTSGYPRIWTAGLHGQCERDEGHYVNWDEHIDLYHSPGQMLYRMCFSYATSSQSYLSD
jgi:hypothetical protein